MLIMTAPDVRSALIGLEPANLKIGQLQLLHRQYLRWNFFWRSSVLVSRVAVEDGAELSTAALMKPLTSISSLILAGLWGAVLPITAQVNVTQEHNHLSRDGFTSIQLSRGPPLLT